MQANPKLADILEIYTLEDSTNLKRPIIFTVSGVMKAHLRDESARFEDLKIIFSAEGFIRSAKNPADIHPEVCRHLMNSLLGESYVFQNRVGVQIQKVRFYHSRDPEHDEMFMDYFFPDWRMNRVK